MMTVLLLAASITHSPLIKDGMTEAERLAALRPFLDPPPGEMVQVDEQAVHEELNQDNPLHYKLYVKVSPPKGHCFTITQHPSVPDRRVCHSQTLATPVGQIADDGTFSWRISTGKGDFGYTYTWKTPHRIAQVIPAATRNVQHSVVMSCSVDETSKDRRLILNMLNKERWAITFPQTDTLEDQPAPFPNLYVVGRSASGGGITDKSNLEVARPNSKIEHPTTSSTDAVTAHWTIPARNHFTMNASAFKTTDSPPGMTGKCRYKYTGAANDPASGWIECHKTAVYDVVFVHLPCAHLISKPTTD